MRYVTRLSIVGTFCVAMMTTSNTLAIDGFARWEQRIPGHPVVFSDAPTTDLHRHCPDFIGPLEERGIRGGFTPDCEARLDEQFLHEIPPLMPFEAKDNRITWRYVFQYPLAKRSLVLNSLSKPECLSIPANAPIADLVEKCRADAIADYAVLKYHCGGDYYGIRGRIAVGNDFPWWYFNPLERIFDNESYWKKRYGIERAYFRYAWITAKCAGVPDGALASLGVFENTMEFRSEPAPGEEGWWWAEQGFEAFQLMGIADRLFDNLTRTKYGYENETLSVWQSVQPVMTELLQIKDLGIHRGTTEGKAVRLKHFIAAQTWIKKRREDVSEDWLLEQVGEFTDDELAQAAEEATEMMSKQGVGTDWN